jgi:hypothetical protein
MRPPGSSSAPCSRSATSIASRDWTCGSTSLARDLVEYKRELNKATSFVDRRMGNFVCAELERVVSDDGRYRDYLSPEARARLLS